MKTLKTNDTQDWIKYAWVVTENGKLREDALAEFRVDCLAKWLYVNSHTENDLFYLSLLLRNRWIKQQYRFHKRNYNLYSVTYGTPVPIEWCELYNEGFMYRKMTGIYDLALVKGDCLWLHSDWTRVFKELVDAKHAYVHVADENGHFLSNCKALARELIQKGVYYRPDFYDFQADDWDFAIHPNQVYATPVAMAHYSKLLMPKNKVMETASLNFYNRCQHIWLPDEELNLKGFE